MLFLLSLSAWSQKSRAQLEREKKNNLKKIAQAEKILSQTKKDKKASLGQLRALNQQIKIREKLIRSLGQEVNVLESELSDLQIVERSLLNDLKNLKEEYAEQIYKSQKANRGNNKLMFLFSSESFNQLVKRMKYLQQYSKARKLQAEQIEVVSQELHNQRQQVEIKKSEQERIFKQQLKESRKLTKSRKQQSQLVANLSKKEKDLKKELDRRKKAIKNLNKLIARIVNREVAKSNRASLAENASKAEITRSFSASKHRLSWPVKSGFITSRFGKQRHPVLKRITIINDGIGIQTEKNAKVKAVFNGVVTQISNIPGMNNIVIVKHGDYYTVYGRLKTLNVKKGQKIKAGDIIGEVYTNKEGVSELEFQVYKGTKKLNPEKWLSS